ncbi:MAG: two-component system cell cycle response regulator [Phycisphaerales bacterium]|jgi:two-component system cell cycle response regulator
MRHDILDEILNAPTLPSLPAVAGRVLELTSDPDVKMSELAGVIQQDQAMSAKILRTVNSSFFSLSKPCSSIEKALVLLGLSPVKSLVLGFSLVSSLKGQEEDSFDYISYWRRGLYTAIAAKLFAQSVLPNKADEAFLAGLLQDVGMIAMFRGLGVKYMHVVNRNEGGHADLAREEILAFEYQHADVGAMLCESWKLPQELILPVKYHERPTASPQSVSRLVQCVAMGNQVHNAMTEENGAVAIRALYNRTKQWWDMAAEDVDEILRRSTAAFAEIADLFDVDAGETADADEVLAKAEARLVEMAKQKPRESFAATGLDGLILGGAMTDPLTGAIEKPGFDSSVRLSFESARSGKIQLSLVQVLAEGLTGIGTEFGELVQDEVAIGIVVLLQRFFEPLGGIVCRLADQVFAVVLPDTSRLAASKAAEEFANQIDKSLSHWLPAGAVPAIPFKASVGVATIDDESRAEFISPDQLIVAATRSVQTARRNQTSSVRVFTPRAAA